MQKTTAGQTENNSPLSSAPSFKEYLFDNPFSVTVLKLSAVAVLVQFVLFKLLYPYAGFINGDSYTYLDGAFWNASINFYMIGYSVFLRLFSVFTYSDTALVAFQYLSVQVSSLFLLFTVFYFYKPGKVVQIILFCFMVFNPLFLYMSNYVSSDSLFLAISMVWFSVLLWIIHRPSTKLILWNSLLLFFAFTFRYNALSYPFIAILAFALSNSLSLRKKLAGIGLGMLVVGLFMMRTANNYKLLTGTWQYSPFSGWQLANNAMYAYRFVDKANRKPVPEKFRQLDDMIRAYFDSSRDVKRHPDEAALASTVYMWDTRSPLYKYREWQFRYDSTASDFKRWASMGPLYSAYGLHIIRQYPGKFAKYFLWPNFNKYYATPVEFLEKYNSGDESVADIAQRWFLFRSNKVHTAFKDPHVHMLDFYPILTGMMNVLFLSGLVCFLILNGFRNNRVFSKGILMAACVWIVNLGFTVFASSAALRFQAFPILLLTSFALLLVDYALKTVKSLDVQDRSLGIRVSPAAMQQVEKLRL